MRAMRQRGRRCTAARGTRWAPEGALRGAATCVALACASGCVSLVEQRAIVTVVNASSLDSGSVEVEAFVPVGRGSIDAVSTAFLYPIETVCDVLSAPSIVVDPDLRVRRGFLGGVAAILLPGLNLRRADGFFFMGLLRSPVELDAREWSALRAAVAEGAPEDRIAAQLAQRLGVAPEAVVAVRWCDGAQVVER